MLLERLSKTHVGENEHLGAVVGDTFAYNSLYSSQLVDVRDIFHHVLACGLRARALQN